MPRRLAWIAVVMVSLGCGTVSKDPDAGSDGAPGDSGGGVDACPGCPDAPRLIAPTNGAYTGSVLAASSLRPRFRWQAVATATEYQLEVDDSCPLEGFAGCTFESPEAQVSGAATDVTLSESLPVSLVAPVGRRYVWRVRACNATGCGPWSPGRYLLVGQQASDVNGDGFADLVVSAPFNESAGDPAFMSEGMVSIFFGRSALPATLADDDVTLSAPVPQQDGRFGIVNAVGDVNGDGFGDLLITSAQIDDPEDSEGGAYLYYGRATWGAQVTAADVVIDSPRDVAGSWMGGVFSAGGDVNGDGYSDLVMDCRNAPVGGTLSVGEVHIWLGGASLPARLDASTTRIDNPTGAAMTAFGRVGTGDINGDGYVDVLTASAQFSNPETSEGNVLVFLGRPAWPALLNAPDVTIDHPLDSVNGSFGFSNLACDLNDDGFADVVSGDRENDPGLPGFGKVFFFFGRAEWTADVQMADVQLDNPHAFDSQYGERKNGCADVTGDGIADLFISGVDYGTATIPQTGEAYLYVGRATWPATGAAVTTVFGSPTLRRSDHFGLPPHPFGDFDGDGLTDVGIGASDAEPPAATDVDNRGRAYLYRGRTTWPETLNSANVTFENPTGEGNGAFGNTLD